MTKFQKQMLTIAAAGALTAVTALPAMALENEFKGSFNVRWVMSNWEVYENQVVPYTSQSGTLRPYGAAGTVLNAWPFYNLAGGLNANAALTGVNSTRGLSAQRYWYPASNPSMSNYFEQRAVLMYSAKASDKLALRTAFEIDSRWGDTSYGVGRNVGGGIGADQVNLETKNVYLDFTCPLTDAQVKVGIQGFNDQYKGIFLGPVDMAGINIQKKFGKATATLGFFRLNDQLANATSTTTSNYGRYTRDIVMLDTAYAVSKDFNVGLTYYYYKDNTSASQAALAASAAGINNAAFVLPGGQAAGDLVGSYNLGLHTIGIRTDAKFGKLLFDASFLAQAGRITDNPIVGVYPGLQNNEHISSIGFAAQAGMKYNTDNGQFKAAFLWTSGDNQANYYQFYGSPNGVNNAGPWAWYAPRDTKRTAFINVQSATREAVYTGLSSMIMMTSVGRFGASDRAVVPDIYNFGQGVTAGSIGYDAKFGKGYLNTNVVAVAATANNSNDIRHINKLTNQRNNSRYMGTEINIEPGYKLYDNLTVYTQFAYAFLGDYFKNAAGNNGQLPAAVGVPTLVYNSLTPNMVGFATGLVPMSLTTTAKNPTDPYSLKIGFVYSF